MTYGQRWALWLALALGSALLGAMLEPSRGQAQATEGLWEVTAYCHQGTRTASGTYPQAGTIAAPREVPFGAQLAVAGYGLGVVEDRGGAIWGRRLDVWFPTCWQAIQWGRRWVWVSWGWPDGGAEAESTPESELVVEGEEA